MNAALQNGWAHLITVLAAIGSVTYLAAEKVVSGDAAVAVISGAAGLVVGGYAVLAGNASAGSPTVAPSPPAG